MSEVQTKTKVEIEGPLVLLPEYKLTTANQKPVCKLIFPIKCFGQGDINNKDYWLQVNTFGELAQWCRGLLVGQEVVCVGRIAANRWMSKRDGKEKASQNIIAFRVGVRESLSASIKWFVPTPKKKQTDGKYVLGPEGDVEEDTSEGDLGPEDLPSGTGLPEVDAFLRGQDSAKGAS